MAHPMAGQAKSSQQARLKRLGATAGKGWGSSQMYKASSYPKKGAGSSTSMTISGGSAKSRPDRYAAGGLVGDKKKRKPGATTNIIISHAGGRGGSGGGGGAGPPPGGGPGGPVPVPVPRPVPVPVNAGAGPAVPPGAGPAAPLIRPPVAPPVAPVGGPPVGGLPPGGPPIRPPGMKTGGSVMKAASGGFLKDGPRKAYRGFPHSPTTKEDSAVSAHKKGGVVGTRHAKGGSSAEGVAVEGRGHGLPGGGRSAEGVAVEGKGHGLTPPGKQLNTGTGKTYGDDDTGVPGALHGKKKVKKLQFGGGAGGQMGLGGGGQSPAAPPGGAGLMGIFPGRQPVPEQQGPPNVSGRPMMPAQPLTVPQPKMGSSVFQRPAPGTTVGYRKGGFVPKQEKSKDPGLVSSKYHQQGKGFASGGSVTGGAGAGSGIGRLFRSKKGS